MTRNNNTTSILLPILVALILGMAVFGYFEYKLMQDQLADREKFIQKLEKKNSSERKFYQSKLDSIAVLSSNTSYKIDNKDVSVSSIIKSANEWYQEKERLKIELQNCQILQKAYEKNFNDVGNLYKTEVSRGNDNAKSANNNAKIANAWAKNYKDITTRFNPDKYKEYEFFYQSVKKHFGLDYEVEINSDSTRTLKFNPSSKLDSALGYFEAFKAGRIKTNIIFKDVTKEKKKKQ